MCCFSVATPAGLFARLLQPKVHVSKTNIFARMIAPSVQALAYGMNLTSAREVAMILPLPVVPGHGDDAVTFINLERSPRMFDELGALFEPPARKSRSAAMLQGTKLVVHDIGAFIASYVPRRADFARLDERFRLPEILFDAIPAYADYGFAVFQLSPGDVTVHPMAMTFPTRTPDQLFFPTVHVHDGRFHRVAKFDHALYYQAAAPVDEVGWANPIRDYAGIVMTGQAIARRRLRAKLPNRDIWIAAT